MQKTQCYKSSNACQASKEADLKRQYCVFDALNQTFRQKHFGNKNTATLTASKF